jgi:hypothetical protein
MRSDAREPRKIRVARLVFFGFPGDVFGREVMVDAANGCQYIER